MDERNFAPMIGDAPTSMANVYERRNDGCWRSADYTIAIMAPRVSFITEGQAPVSARAFFADGDPGPLVSSWAQVPEMLDVTLPFVGMILGASSVSARLKELVILRTSALMQCRFCVNAHTEVAIDVGLTESEIRALRGEIAIGDTFSTPGELALLRWIDAVATQRGAVDDDIADDLGAHFHDHEVVEVTMLIGATLMLNRYASALQLPNGDEAIGRLQQLGYDTVLTGQGAFA